MPSIIVKDSMIRGQGVFAVRDILSGEVIIDWDECSEILTGEDVEKLSPAERKRFRSSTASISYSNRPPVGSIIPAMRTFAEQIERTWQFARSKRARKSLWTTSWKKFPVSASSVSAGYPTVGAS
jgi:hypothetical protein